MKKLKKDPVRERNYKTAVGFVGLLIIGAISYLLVLLINKLKTDNV